MTDMAFNAISKSGALFHRANDNKTEWINFVTHRHSYEIVGSWPDLAHHNMALGVRNNALTIDFRPAPSCCIIPLDDDRNGDASIHYQVTLPNDADTSRLIAALEDDFFRIIIGRSGMKVSRRLS